jgi:hypothetical protein
MPARDVLCVAGRASKNGIDSRTLAGAVTAQPHPMIYQEMFADNRENRAANEERTASSAVPVLWLTVQNSPYRSKGHLPAAPGFPGRGCWTTHSFGYRVYRDPRVDKICGGSEAAANCCSPGADKKRISPRTAWA